MNLIQFRDSNDASRVAIVRNHHEVEPLDTISSMRELALLAIGSQQTLTDLAASHASGRRLDYQQLVDNKRLLPPLHHDDPAHVLVSGTGLTHLGSADARAAMHRKIQGNMEELTDSMKMFRLGVEGGKPAPGQPGVQPEWFYKGDGDAVTAPGQPVVAPDFSLDLGDEAEIVGLYVIGPDRRAWRLGFALGNEYSDHRTERMNYLYLAHSKLRRCSVGPELRTGTLPQQVEGVSRIRRAGKVLWEKPFLSGEANMSHSISNLEYHHFKYRNFLRPGDVHIHFFGTGTLSFADGIATQVGDTFELECPLFGRALCNEYRTEQSTTSCDQPVLPL